MSDISARSESAPQNPLAAVYQESAPILRRVTEVRSPSLSELRRRAGIVSEEIRDKFSDQPRETVEGVLDLSLGFLRLDQDTLVMEGIKPPPEQRELSARLQHTYSDLIVKAGEGQDPDLSSTLYSVLKDWQDIKNQRIFSQGKLPTLWRGTESEIALIRALKKAGYNVRLPDYNQDPSTPPEKREVLQWDVLSGVDVIAEKDGRVLLLDAKGKIDQAAPELGNPEKVDVNYEPNELVRETVSAMNPKSVIRSRVYIPSDTRSFIPLPPQWPKEHPNPNEVLNNFGRLRPVHEIPLVDQLERIEKVAKPIDRRFA